MRGLAYYTGIVFELFDAIGEFRAICGGGRYDQLLASLGGVDLPALGFGLGDVVLGELLRARGLMPTVGTAPDFWIAQSPEASDYPASMLALASALRRTDFSVEYALRSQRVDKQVEAARKANARHIVVLDPRADRVSPVRVIGGAREDEHFQDIEAFITWASSTTRIAT